MKFAGCISALTLRWFILLTVLSLREGEVCEWGGGGGDGGECARWGWGGGGNCYMWYSMDVPPFSALPSI